MSGKFMKVKKIAVSTLTLIMIASQLAGCAGVSQQEAVDMIDRNDTIEIEVAVPDDKTQEDTVHLHNEEWIELGSLTTYPEFRAKIDEIFGNGENNGEKYGPMYVNPNGILTNNSTLKYAFRVKAFVKILTTHEESVNKWVSVTKDTYTDIESDLEAMMAMLDTYFNIFDNNTDTYGGNQTLTRAEFLTGVYKANTPVRDLEANIELNYDNYSPFVNQMMSYSYLNLKDGSMTEDTYNGTITRAEAIYTIARMFYSDEFILMDNNFEGNFTDAKNGGYNTDATINCATELNNALQNPDGGMPADLYKALVIAQVHDIINDGETRWDESITKSEAMELLIRTYLSMEAWEDVPEKAEEQENDTTTESETVEVSKSIIKKIDGKVYFTKDVQDAVLAKLDKAGVPAGYTNKVIEDYYEVSEGQEITELNMETLDNIINSLDKQLEAQEQAQKAQQEEKKQQQQQNNSGNSNGNNTGNSNSNGNTGNNGGNTGNSNEAPSDWETPEVDNPSNDGPLPGETTIDIFANPNKTGGEIITDYTVNP